MPRPPAQPLDELTRARIRHLLTTRGERTAAALLGVSERTVTRAIAGLGLYPGTHALIRQSLDRLEREVA